MEKQKPKKTIYENQEEILRTIVKELKEKYLKNFSKAYLTGSLVSKKFGKYEKEYEGYLGSDIDIAAIPNKRIPKSWRYKGINHEWNNEYHIGEIKINENLHPINLMIPLKNDYKLIITKTKEIKNKILRIK